MESLLIEKGKRILVLALGHWTLGLWPCTSPHGLGFPTRDMGSKLLPQEPQRCLGPSALLCSSREDGLGGGSVGGSLVDGDLVGGVPDCVYVLGDFCLQRGLGLSCK